MHCLHSVFCWQENKQNIVGSSFARSEHVWFLHAGMLKDKVYSDNFHTQHNMKEIIQNVVLSVTPAEIWCTMKNMFVTLQQIEAYIWKNVYNQ
jgi:hypothetical protein